MRALIRFLASLRGGRLVVGLVIAVALALILGRALTAAYVEVLWQAHAGYAGAFWKRILWQWGVRTGAGVAVGALVFVNLRLASATLGGIHIRRRFGNIEISEQIPQNYVSMSMLGAATLLGLWFGAAVPANLGTQILVLVSSQPWGLRDPVLGHDTGFYVFALPVLNRAVTFGLVVTFLIFTLSTAAYAATGALRWVRGRVDAQDLARIHLGAIIAAFLGLLGIRLWIGRYLLLLDGNSAVQGIFGYADAQARLPALQTLTVICFGAGVGILWGVWKNRMAPVIASVASVVIGTIVIGEVYPSVVQNFRVEPNELQRESPYIEDNLEFTRRGFGLDSMARGHFEHDATEAIDWTAAARELSGLPVWSRGALLTSYRELEARFPYYDFSDVTIDRYTTPDGPLPVAISVREVEPSGIQDPNWQNRHLRELYIEGMGVVASRASTRSPEGRPEMLLTGIPPELSAAGRDVRGLELARPQVFFGIRPQPYALVNAGPREFLAADSTPGVPGVDFPTGIELGSRLRTALLAWQFRDANLLFSTEVDDSSRFVYRRRVVDRAQAIAPFLRFPENPYPVVARDRIMWVLEGYTDTRWFPLSTVDDFGTLGAPVSYVRNSVKVTVDAVTGDVTFYRVPIADPIADAYQTAFPSLFHPVDEMPHEIRDHIRYPRELMNVQARVLLQYHQETPREFHGQQDVWDGPQELAENTSPVAYRPEYGIYSLPGDPVSRFYLTTVFVPAGRQNLTAILAGTTDDSGVPSLRLLDVPVADQIAGPRQVEALVEQDPVISQQFSLWRTGGSEVWTGHLFLVPVGKHLLYMEPVFLAAAADAIPELRRVVVSDGRRVAMTDGLAAAIAQLGGQAPVRAVNGSPRSATDAPSGSGAWPAAALRLLERAEASARLGDWQGFGAALEELRSFLQQLDAGGSR